MFSHRNPGRQYIRSVVFDQSNLDDKLDPPAGYTHLAGIFLTWVPVGQLEFLG